MESNYTDLASLMNEKKQLEKQIMKLKTVNRQTKNIHDQYYNQKIELEDKLQYLSMSIWMIIVEQSFLTEDQ